MPLVRQTLKPEDLLQLGQSSFCQKLVHGPAHFLLQTDLSKLAAESSLNIFLGAATAINGREDRKEQDSGGMAPLPETKAPNEVDKGTGCGPEKTRADGCKQSTSQTPKPLKV